jgi:hypothetical protein
MSTSTNPFPAYPVATLQPGSTDQDGMTVTTAGIEKSDRLLRSFLADFGSPGAVGLNVAVKGEFGTGKTHLLTHAERQLRDGAAKLGTAAGVVVVGAMEATPVDWYRAMLGPRVGRLGLDELITDLYARAAATVARRAPLSAGAATRLEIDPAAVHLLLSDELLSSSSVDRELFTMLERIAPETRPQVRAAIEGLISAPAPARRWLEGERLSEREVVACGLAEPISSDQEAADVLVVLAAIHRELGRPFMLMIDELEHLARFDERGSGSSNLTWLKRLLERLEKEGACLFVAGHTSAWGGHPDFLERFSLQSVIELEPLSPEDVVHIIDRFAPGRTTFDEADIDLINEFCGGNIRRTLGVLHALYRNSNGFELGINRDMLTELSAGSKHLAEPEQAIDDLGRALERDGMRVSRRAALHDLTFDLIAYRDESPVVVVEAKHALFGRKQQDQAQRFVDKLRVINRESPACIGLFASSGAFDPELLKVGAGAARVFWFDLDRPDFVANVETTIRPVLREPPPADATTAGSDRDRALTELVEEIQAIKEAQAADYARLEDQLSAPGTKASALQFRSPEATDTHDERRAIFEDLSAYPPLRRQLALIGGPALMLIAIGIIVGLGLILINFFGDSLIGESREGESVQAILAIAGVVLLLLATLLGARQLLLLDRFFAFKRERLRDIYVLDRPTAFLIETSRTIDEALYDNGPQLAIGHATELLEERELIAEHRRWGREVGGPAGYGT